MLVVTLALLPGLTTSFSMLVFLQLEVGLNAGGLLCGRSVRPGAGYGKWPNGFCVCVPPDKIRAAFNQSTEAPS